MRRPSRADPVTRSPASGADYVKLVGELKARIAAARFAASRSVNRELILLYWDIGSAIVERQRRLGWGDSVVEVLARDLRDAFPGTAGFSARNLRDMKRFFRAYSEAQFWRHAVAKTAGAGRHGRRPPDVMVEVPWGHHLLILNKVTADDARLFYLRASAISAGRAASCSTRSRRRSSDR